MFYVYILLLRNGDFYKGATSELKRRIAEHHSGKVKSTKDLRPIKLIYYEAYLLESDAKRREQFLKTTEGRRFLRRQLRDLLVKYKNGSVRLYNRTPSRMTGRVLVGASKQSQISNLKSQISNLLTDRQAGRTSFGGTLKNALKPIE